jgi:hypothetical protein
VIAHQFIGQLTFGANKDTAIRDAIFGNVGTMCVNRIGIEDAEFIAKEFAPTLSEFDLVNVEAFTFNIKMLINGQPSKPFNFSPLRVRLPKTDTLAQLIRELSRRTYGRPRAIVEAEISERRAVASEGPSEPREPDAGSLF